MNLSYINAQNWNDFQERFSDAYQFLLRRSLWNEFWHLKTRKAPLNEWEKTRLLELSLHFEGTTGNLYHVCNDYSLQKC